MTLPNRREHRSQQFSTPFGEMTVCVGFDPETGHPVEVFVTQRTKSGTALDDFLYEIGVTISKLMQDEQKKRTGFRKTGD